MTLQGQKGDITMTGLIKAKILKNDEISPGIYDLHLMSEKFTREGFPGKFVNIYLENSLHILPRPISICQSNAREKSLRLIYGLVGKGTRIMAQKKTGDELMVLGPLGNGFSLDKAGKKNLLIAGGLGVPPLLELAKNLQGHTTAYLGFKKDPILVEEFSQYVDKVHVATEDGGSGFKGNVLDLLRDHKPGADIFYSCGPKPMLKAIQEWARENSMEGELSVEERMACGIGACLVCTCKIAGDGGGDWTYKRVCKDGPVFSRDEVIW